MAAVSKRLRARIDRDFPDRGSAEEVARLVAGASDSERIQAAIVLWAQGDLNRLLDSIALTAVDWRDTLVRGGIEHEDWASRLDAELGPSSRYVSKRHGPRVLSLHHRRFASRTHGRS